MDPTMITDAANKLSGLYFSNPDADIESELAKVASSQSLNANMVERIVNRTNRNIILGLQKQARLGSLDPHFTFPRISTGRVISILRRPASGVVGLGPTLPPRPLPSLEISSPEPVPACPPASGMMDVVLALKQKVAEKKAVLIRFEMALDDMLNMFMKRASHELLGGTPIDIFEALPVDITPVVEKVAQWGHPIRRIEENWELDENNPLVKLAFDIAEVDKKRKWAEKELGWAEGKLNEARSQLRGMS